MDKVKDITYCNFKECKRNCERNIKNHDFYGQIYSISQFDRVESWTEENCSYYYPMESNYERSEM